MKILHIIDSLGLGGAQTVVKGIFEAQKKNKRIYLYALRKREINIKIDHPNVKTFNSESKYSFKPLKELRELIEHEKIDILHCHLPKSQFFGYLLKKRYFPKIKLVFHEHGDIFGNNNRLPVATFLRHSQKKVDLFIAVSKATKQKLIEKAKIDPDKIKVLYNFVDLKRFNRKNIKLNIQKEREKLGIEKGKVLVGFAGRLIERKGWRDFVEAANLLVKENKNYKFLIVGDGADREKMILLIKKYGLIESVIYLGYKSDMVWFYSLLDLFVIPSHWEPMGLTPIEAQSLEIPVIASDVPGLNEIVSKESAILFKKKDYFDLFGKITSLSNSEKRKKLIKLGVVNSKRYDLSFYLKNLEAVYHEI